MRQLKEGFIKEFVSLGKEVEHNGQKLRPNTRTNVAIGKIHSLDEQSKGNLKCVMKVTGAKYDFSGYLNDGTPVADLLKQAFEHGHTVAARFERKRTKQADPTEDIMELTKDMGYAKGKVVWIVAGVYNYGTSEWILTSDAVSNPAEDPDYVKIDLEAAAYSTEGFFADAGPKVSNTEKDKKANHLVSMYTYGAEHSHENGIGLNDKQLKILASYMLKACDTLQMRAKNIPTPNYGDYSHTKARGMLFSWMRVNPLSKEIMESGKDFNSWISRFLTENTELWKWAQNEVEKEN